jgi:plasmid stabilization system protein ParE
MKRKIFWSEEAEIRIVEITNYLHTNWSDKSAEIFLNILDDKISLLVLFPEMCESSPTKKGIRRCVITKHIFITLWI